MKFQNLSLIACAVMLSACSASNTADNSGAAPTPAPTDSQISIRVKSTANAGMPNAVVKLGSATETTDSEGYATFTVDPKFTGTATLSKPYHLSKQIQVGVGDAGSSSNFEATVLAFVKAGENVDFSTATVGTPVKIDGTENASVTLTDPNSWVDANGDPYTGPVDVYITPIDVTDDTQGSTVPGGFNGVVDGQTEAVPIVSYGMTEFTFYDQDGNELALSQGAVATIDIPVFQEGAIAGLDAPAAGDTMPMWWYDYEKEEWIENPLEQGTIVDVGGGELVLRGRVNHFTTWNADDLFITGFLTIEVGCHEGYANPTMATVNYVADGASGTVNINGSTTAAQRRIALPEGEVCLKTTNVSTCSSDTNPQYEDEVCVTIAGDQSESTVTIRPILR